MGYKYSFEYLYLFSYLPRLQFDTIHTTVYV